MNATKIKGIALIVLLAVSYGSSPSLGQTKAERGSGDQEQKQSEATAAKGKPPEKVMIDPEVYERLAKRPDGRLYVMVTLKPLSKDAVSDAQRKAAAKKSQDELLAETPPEVFSAGYRCERVPILFGYVKTAGLQKLARNTKVQSVQYKVEPEVHRRLKKSSDGFVFVLVVVNSPECARLWAAIPDTHDARPLLQEVGRLARRTQDEILSDMSSREFKLFSRDEHEPDFFGWATKEGLEKLVRDPRVQVGWGRDEPPREWTNGVEER